MNKDMINIDDFVREKLNGHPQKDDSAAAWLKMKELLDKEKPEKVAPFLFRWRKPMAFFGAAILLSVLCVGGYQLNQLRQEEQIDAPYTSNNTENQSPKSNFSNHNDSNPLINKAPIKDAEPAQQSKSHHQEENQHLAKAESSLANSAESTKPKNTVSHSEKQNNNTTSANTSQHLGKQNKVVHPNSGSNALAATSPAKNKVSSAADNLAEASKNSLENKSSQNQDVNATDKRSTSAAAQNKDVQNAKDEFSANKTNASGNNKQNLGSDQFKTKNTSIAATSKNNKEEQALANSQDSIPTTTIVTKEKSSKGFPRKTISHSDTIASGKVALPNTQTNKPNNTVKSTQASDMNKTPAQDQNKKTATTREKRKDEFAGKTPNLASKTVPNAEQKNTVTTVKKEKSKAAKWLDNLNLPQAAADAKRDFKNAKFYTGFSAGANYSISNSNNFQGVQFGPTGELVFNKHWSLFGAIKYFNRSGGKKTVNDSYAKEIANDTPSISGPNWYYKVHTDSTNRFFNFSTLHSFELPITIRYAFKKFYVMTGINLAYYLGVNVEEVSKTHSNQNPHFVQTNSTKPILKESKPTLATTDFGSRFGVGYVIGAGYQIAPAWQADLRVVNNFWDNSKGNGAQKLSKDFYKLPSLQISIGYQFNRGKSKATFGPTDNH